MRTADRSPGTARRILALLEASGRLTRVLAAGGPPPVVAVITLRDPGPSVALATLAGELLAELSRELPGDGRHERGPVDAEQAGGAHPSHAPGPLLEPAGRLLRSALGEASVAAERLSAVVVSVAAPRADAVDLAGLGSWDAPLLAENDANLGALGEAAFGAGRGLDSFVYVMLGHGVGAGLIVGGRLHRGAAGFAGELAHVQLREQEDGPLCVCGGRGCLGRAMGASLHGFVARAYAERLSVPEVLSLAAAREPGVRRVFADLGRAVGRPLADLCTMLDPAAVVVDGNLGAAGESIISGIREAIDGHAAPPVADSAQALPGDLDERAELLGGVALARGRHLDAI